MPVPPTEPVVVFYDPQKIDVGLVEYWSTEIAAYQAIDIGTPHPKTREYPGFRLGLQKAVENEDGWVRRVWVRDETSPDWFNYEVKFAAEAVAFPTYIRQYRIDKKLYSPLTKGTSLTAVIMLRLATAGSGYTYGSFPSVTFSGGGGSGASGHAVVNPDGTIADVVIDTGGAGYTTTPTATVAPPPVGVTATATAVIQPQSAKLVAEQAEEFPKDGEFFGLFFNVTRVYETLPGPTLEGTRLDDDGMVVTMTHTRGVADDIVSSEVIDTGLWIKTTKKETGNLYVAEQVQETRLLPGNPMPDTKVDKDGVPKDIVKTLKDITTITEGEVVTVGNVWITTEKNAVSDLVAWEVVTARQLPGNVIPSNTVGADHEISNIYTRLRKADTISPSATESGGFITTVEQREVTDLVSDEITTVKRFLDEAFYSISIPNLIPEWARPQIPTLVESHILAGTASPPTLVSPEFSASEKQLTKLLYERRVEKIPDDVDFPVVATNQETTEEYGGGILNVTLTLDDNAQTVDEGLLVVSSETKTLAVYTSPSGVLTMKETKELDDTAWSVLSSRLWDENMRLEYGETKQVVAAGTSESADPGGSVFAWVSEVKAIDKWRSLKINTSKTEPAYNDVDSALIHYEYKPYRFPGLLYRAPAGYYVRRADATLVQHKIKTWWLKSATTPTVTETGGGGDVEIDEIIMDDVVISSLNNTTTLDYSGMVLHDDLVTFGALFYPATTPSYTEYALGTVTGTSTTNAASIFQGGSGYSVSDTLTIASGGYTMSVDVTFVYDVGATTGIIGGTTTFDPTGTFPAGSHGPITATGGGGGGAAFTVFSADVPTYTPGTGWIGTYRIIGAEIKPEREKDIWRIVTESVVMR